MLEFIATDGVIFDLDGTLWDSNATCAVAWNRVIARLGIEYRPITRADVQSVAGRPHDEAVATVLRDLDAEQVAAVAAGTAVEDTLAVRELGGTLYPGVADGVRELASRFALFIVSNCQSGYIEAFLGFSQLSDCFRDIECWGNTGASKSHNLRSVIARNALQRPVFMGDTAGDHRAARDNSVPFLHAAYGFGKVPDCEGRIERFDTLAALLHPN